MQIEYDIPYKQNPVKTCDIYKRRVNRLPDGKQPAIVILIHGGVWSFGNKQRLASIAMTLCQRTNCVCVIPEYSLSAMNTVLLQHALATQWICLLVVFFFIQNRTILFLSLCLSIVTTILLLVYLLKQRRENKQKHDVVHPAHCVDLACCIQFVHTNAHNDFMLADSTKIVLIGHSAGAHLGALVFLNPRFLDDKLRICIRGIVCISGVYCFFQLQRSLLRHFVNNNVFAENGQGLSDLQFEKMQSFKECGCDKCMLYFQRWELIIDAWPIFHTQRRSHHQDVNAAFLLLTSDMDFTLIDHAVDFEQSLRTEGWKVQHLHCKRVDHFSIRKHWDFKNKHIGKAVADFINITTLKSQKEQ